MSEEIKDEHTFDIDSMQLTNKLVDIYQEGNYLVATTETGIKFRQHIKPGKRLNKKGGKFVLESMEVV